MSRNASRMALLNDRFTGGGTERVLSYLSVNLFRQRSGMVFLFDDTAIDFEYGGELVGLGVKPPPYDGLFQEGISLLGGVVRLRRAKRRHGVELCISQKEGPNFVNVLSSASKSIVTVHEHKSTGMRYRGIRRLLIGWLIRFLYNRASCVVTVSREIARDLAVNFGITSDKLQVIYNPCDVEMIERRCREPLAAEHEGLFDGPTVVTAGRLVTQKGHWYLLRAFAAIGSRFPKARLLILGTGDHLPYLQRLTTGLGIADRVHFLGYQENPFKFVARSDVFALPSLWEGFPAILMEAMACGVPVVSTDCPSGPRELLEPAGERCTDLELARHGLLLPAFDGAYRSAAEPLSREETLFSEALARLLEDRALRERYGAAGRARAAEFTMHRYIAQWDALIESVTRGAPRTT